MHRVFSVYLQDIYKFTRPTVISEVSKTIVYTKIYVTYGTAMSLCKTTIQFWSWYDLSLTFGLCFSANIHDKKSRRNQLSENEFGLFVKCFLFVCSATYDLCLFKDSKVIDV